MDIFKAASISDVNNHYLIKNDYTLYDRASWEKDYIEWLNHKYLLKEKCVNPYNDPDTSSYQYYKDLSIYLNKKEKDEKYTYEPWGMPLGIRVKKDGTTLFFLYSDQLGFSEHKKNNDSPYEMYLRNRMDKGFKRVANWIYNTRTLGGGFLWPYEVNSQGHIGRKMFNTSRGSHQDDRVDLTINLIKNFYNISEDDCKGHFSRDKNLFKWLRRFGNGPEGFKNWMDFMALDVFCDDKMNVKNIISKEENSVLGREQITGNGFEINATQEIGFMLDKVCTLITNRTRKMEQFL